MSRRKIRKGSPQRNVPMRVGWVFSAIFEQYVVMGCVKMQDMKMQDVKMKDQVAWQENAGHENEGPSCKA